MDLDTARGRETRIARLFDFDHPESGLNEFVVTTQFRVARGGERGDSENDRSAVIPDLVLFVNGIPLVVMEAKSPSIGDVWKTAAVRQLRRYQEAGPEWRGAGAPALFDYNLLCVAHCGAAAAYAGIGAPEDAYVEWKSLLPYSEDEARARFGVEPEGQAQLIIGLLAPATLLDVLRDFVVFEPERGRLVKKLPRYQQYRAVHSALERILRGRRPEERGGVVWHTQGSGKSLTMLWLATKLAPRAASGQSDDRRGDRPQAARPSDKRHVRTLRLSGARAGVARTPIAGTANYRARSHGDDHHSEVRGRPCRAGGRAGRTRRVRERNRDGGRGAPHAIRDTRRADVEGAAQRNTDRFHGHAHRQGLPAQHHAALWIDHRLVHDPAVSGGWRDGTHLVRGAAAGLGDRGAGDARQAVDALFGDESEEMQARIRRRYRTRRPWPRRSDGSR